MAERHGPPALAGAAAELEMRRLTRRGFIVAAGAALAGFGAWRWLTAATPDDGVPWPLRRMLRFNESLAQGLGGPRQLAPTFPADSVQSQPRTNGQIGLAGTVDRAAWQLQVRHENRGPAQTLRLGDVQ